MAERGDKIYLLQRGKKSLRLRATQSHDFDGRTDERKGAVDFRGWVIEIRHNGKLIEKKASQNIIHNLVAKAGSTPRMGKSAKSSRSRRGRR